jgi:hypothetical protein
MGGVVVAELVFSTSSFRPFGSSTSDVPILLDARMRLIEPACAWFLHLALVQSRTRSPATWRTYAEALYDWWQICEANGWKWNRIGYEEVAAYRNRMLSGTSDLTGRPYARSTSAVLWLVCAARTDRHADQVDDRRGLYHLPVVRSLRCRPLSSLR